MSQSRRSPPTAWKKTMNAIRQDSPEAETAIRWARPLILLPNSPLIRTPIRGSSGTNTTSFMGGSGFGFRVSGFGFRQTRNVLRFETRRSDPGTSLQPQTRNSELGTSLACLPLHEINFVHVDGLEVAIQPEDDRKPYCRLSRGHGDDEDGEDLTLQHRLR